jgi:hypothetical protein
VINSHALERLNNAMLAKEFHQLVQAAARAQILPLEFMPPRTMSVPRGLTIGALLRCPPPFPLSD